MIQRRNRSFPYLIFLCSKSQSASGFLVKAGEHNLHKTEAGEQERVAVAFKCHENYKKSGTKGRANDIAIIKLDKPIQFSKTINATELPEFNSRIPENSNCFFAGWGDTESKLVCKQGVSNLLLYSFLARRAPDVLQELKLNPHSDYCNQEDKDFDDTTMICADRKVKDSPKGGRGSGCDVCCFFMYII